MRRFQDVEVICDRCGHIVLHVDISKAENIEIEIENQIDAFGWKMMLDENEDLVDVCPNCLREMSTQCNCQAKYVFLWPGEEKTQYICEKHAQHAMNVAEALGLSRSIFQLINKPSFRCMQQEVKNER